MDPLLANLITQTVNTRAKLEVLSFFHHNPYGWESLDGMAQRLHRASADLEPAVADLVHEGLLEGRVGGPGGRETVYSFCRSHPHARSLGELLRLYDGPQGAAVLQAVNAADVQSKARALARRRELDDMKTRFVGMVTHELRTPVTAVRGLLSALLREETPDPANCRPLLERAMGQCDRLTSLVENLLVLSGLHSGGTLDLYLSEVDVPRLVQEILDQQRRLEIAQILVADLTEAPATVVADEYLASQVLGELVANAVKFSPPHSTITVTARTEDDHVRFCVADEGRGVTSRQRAHLFDEFYQAEEDASRRTGGLGLGLYMARRIVERHGGQIWAETHQFAGLTICFTLPLAGPNP